MRQHGASVLVSLALCGCATVPPPSACFSGPSEAIGWEKLHDPPEQSAEMENAAHANPSINLVAPPVEYWFRYYDGDIMLCEPLKKGACDTRTTRFSKDVDGKMVDDGLQAICVSGEAKGLRRFPWQRQSIWSDRVYSKENNQGVFTNHWGLRL